MHSSSIWRSLTEEAQRRSSLSSDNIFITGGSLDEHVLAGRRIDSSLREWLDARLTERGLKDLMDGELSWRVLDYRSENFIQEVDRVMSNQRAKGRGLFGRFRR